MSLLTHGSLEMNSLTPGALVKGVALGVVQALEVAPGAQGLVTNGGRALVIIPGDQELGTNGEVGQGPGGLALGLQGTNGTGVIKAPVIRVGGLRAAQALHGTGTIRDKLRGRVLALGLGPDSGAGLGPTGTGVRQQQQLPGTPRLEPGRLQQLHHNLPPRRQLLTRPWGQALGGRQRLEALGGRQRLEALGQGQEPQQLTQNNRLLTGSKTFQLKPGMRFFDDSDSTSTQRLLLLVLQNLLLLLLQCRNNISQSLLLGNDKLAQLYSGTHKV